MMATTLASFQVTYAADPAADLLARGGTLATFNFGASAPVDDPRWLGVLQAPLAAGAPCERWSVDAEVEHGRAGALRWARGGGWQFTAIEIDAAAGGIEAASAHAYANLLAFVATSAAPHLLRIWNYLGAINDGAGDTERYRLFCNGRARSMAARGVDHYPAATAIGHAGPRERLQVYALSAARAGQALENPRQVSAWQYPREYGPTAPSFARAMLLPQGGIAISGTAAVVGHASHHTGNVAAQATEAIANLRALLARAALPPFDANSPLKVYVRHPADADAVRAVLDDQLDPAVPRLLLQGDICRRNLLVEIDGWRFAPAA